MKKRRVVHAGKNIFLYGLGVCCVFPAVIVLFHSFMGTDELNGAFHLVPENWTLSGYDRLIFTCPEYFDYFWNAVRYAVWSMLPGLPLALLGAYGFVFTAFRLKKLLLFLYMVLMLMPFQATLVPQFLTLQRFGMLDTGMALVLPNLFWPLGTVLIMQYMKSIDKEILEAGKLEGLGSFGLFARIVCPICMPVIGTWIILVFLECWTMFEQPMIFLENTDKFPLSVRLYYLKKEELFPGSILYLILPLLVFAQNRKRLMTEIGFGSVR